MVREFVDRDALADQRRHVAAPHRVLFKVRDVDGDQVHRDATRDRAALAGDHHLGAARAIVTAAGAEISIGIAGRYDREARYIEAAVNGIIVTSIYLPNGNPQPGPKFDYKLEWFKRLTRHAAKFLKSEIPVVLAGDYNVAPAELDIYPTRSWDNDALIQPKSRAAFRSLVAQGWLDAIRDLHPSNPMYTFWDYKRNRWPRDAGLRLDHLLLSPAVAPRLIKAGVDRKVRGEEGASDHAPAWIVLR